MASAHSGRIAILGRSRCVRAQFADVAAGVSGWRADPSPSKVSFTSGHRYPHMPTFGLPYPTVIFTLGLTLWLVRPFPRAMLVIPVCGRRSEASRHSS